MTSADSSFDFNALFQRTLVVQGPGHDDAEGKELDYVRLEPEDAYKPELAIFPQVAIHCLVPP